MSDGIDSTKTYVRLAPLDVDASPEEEAHTVAFGFALIQANVFPDSSVPEDRGAGIGLARSYAAFAANPAPLQDAADRWTDLGLPYNGAASWQEFVGFMGSYALPVDLIAAASASDVIGS